MMYIIIFLLLDWILFSGAITKLLFDLFLYLVLLALALGALTLIIGALTR